MLRYSRERHLEMLGQVLRRPLALEEQVEELAAMRIRYRPIYLIPTSKLRHGYQRYLRTCLTVKGSIGPALRARISSGPGGLPSQGADSSDGLGLPIIVQEPEPTEILATSGLVTPGLTDRSGRRRAQARADPADPPGFNFPGGRLLSPLAGQDSQERTSRV